MKNIIVLISGALFGYGLSLATMIQPEVVLSFLTFSDFGLLLVLGGAVSVTLLAYQFAPKILQKPVLGNKFDSKPMETLPRTLIGAALFGIGWGMSGVCPGPAIAGLGAGSWPMLYVVAAMFAGSFVHGCWFSHSINE